MVHGTVPMTRYWSSKINKYYTVPVLYNTYTVPGTGFRPSPYSYSMVLYQAGRPVGGGPGFGYRGRGFGVSRTGGLKTQPSAGRALAQINSQVP